MRGIRLIRALTGFEPRLPLYQVSYEAVNLVPRVSLPPAERKRDPGNEVELVFEKLKRKLETFNEARFTRLIKFKDLQLQFMFENCTQAT